MHVLPAFILSLVGGTSRVDRNFSFGSGRFAVQSERICSTIGTNLSLRLLFFVRFWSIPLMW